MAFGDFDAEMMANDTFSVPVIYGGQTCQGVLDTSDSIVSSVEGTGFSLRETTLRIYTADLVNVQEDTAITVDGTAYQVRDVRIIDDGLHTVLTLAPS